MRAHSFNVDRMKRRYSEIFIDGCVRRSVGIKKCDNIMKNTSRPGALLSQVETAASNSGFTSVYCMKKELAGARTSFDDHMTADFVSTVTSR